MKGMRTLYIGTVGVTCHKRTKELTEWEEQGEEECSSVRGYVVGSKRKYVGICQALGFIERGRRVSRDGVGYDHKCVENIQGVVAEIDRLSNKKKGIKDLRRSNVKA